MTALPVNKFPPLGPVNLSEPQASTQQSANDWSVTDRAVALAMVEGTSPEETVADAERGDTTSITEAKANYQHIEEGLLALSLEEGTKTLEEIQTDLEQSREKRLLLNSTPDFFVEHVAGINGNATSAADHRYAANMQIAEQEFAAAIAEVEEETGAIGKAVMFFDRYFARAIPIGALEDITFRSERMGRMLLEAGISMKTVEYRPFIRNYIREAMEEGFFIDGNIYALEDAFYEAINAGYDPQANVNAAFGAIDLTPLGALLGKGAKGALGSLTRADTAVGRVAAIQGQEAAADAGSRLMRASPVPDIGNRTTMEPAGFDVGSTIVRPQSARVAEITETNDIVQSVTALDRAGVFGRVAPADKLRKAAQALAEGYTKRVTNAVNNINYVVDSLNNPIMRLDLGKVKDGKPYTGRNAELNAQKAADRSGIPGAKAVQVDEADIEKGFVVRVEERMDLTDVVEPFDTQAVELGHVREALARVFGSNAALDDEYLTALVNMGEAGATKVRSLSKPFIRSLNKVDRNSKRAIVNTFKELRDGKDAGVKTGLSDAEFAERFQQNHRFNRVPTQKDIDAFHALTKFEDAAWIFRANDSMQKYVRQGYQALETSQYGRLVGKRVDSVPRNETVLDIPTGTLLDSNDVSKATVWKLDHPLENGNQYVTRPGSVELLDYSDVLGFNAGGRRVNPNAKYFVSFAGKTPRAFLTTFTEAQAKNALEQLKNIQRFINENGGSLSAVGKSDEFDDLIARNNDWNPSITNSEDFLTLANERRWDFSQEIAYKARNEDLIGVDDLHDGQKWGDYVPKQLTRYDDVLMDYGGGQTFNINPVSAILDDFKNAASHYTHRAYTFNAAGAWVKRAKQPGSGVKLDPSIPEGDFLRHIQEAQITGSHESARRLVHQRSIIRRRLHMKGPVEHRFERFGQEASEFVFNKTGIKMNFSDPSNALLHVGFQSAFGFFNVSQFFMQSAHALSVMSLSPRMGMKSAGIAIPLRMALNAPTSAARRKALARLASFMGESEQTMDELVDYIYSSGRDIIDGDMMELGTGPSYGIAGWGENNYIPSAVGNALDSARQGGRKLLDVGLTPFKAGERLGRMTGMTTAFFEFKKKFPDVSPLSDQGRRWITTREQNLTFNMTAASRPLFQSGPMKVPTQWLSYSFRAAEAVVVGRGLKAGERARLATALMPFYGLTGMGMASAADYFAEAFGMEDKESYIGLKNGVIDWLIAEISPVELSTATRLAPITAFTDLYKNIFKGEATFLEVIGGPSGDITQGILSSVTEAVGEVLNGHTVSLTEDALRILRQPSGLDNIAKGLGILNNGYYRSKTGTVLPFEMSPSDGIAQFFGFSTFEVQEYYNRRSEAFTDTKHFRAFRKEMTQDFQSAIEMMGDNPDRGLELIREVEVKIALSGFSEQEQRDLRRALRTASGDEVYRMIIDLQRRGNAYGAAMFEQILGEEK